MPFAEESFTRQLVARINASTRVLTPEASLLSKEDRMKLNRRILDQLVHDIGSKAIRPADDPCVDSILDRRASKGGGEAAQPRGRLVVCILSKGRPHRLQVLQRGEPVRRAARRYVTAFAASVGLLTKKEPFLLGGSICPGEVQGRRRSIESLQTLSRWAEPFLRKGRHRRPKGEEAHGLDPSCPW